MTTRARCLPLALALLGTAIAGAQAARADEPPEVFAVVVGWNGGSAELPALHFADDDAVRFAMFFAGLGSAARPGRVWLLTDIDTDTAATLARARLDVSPAGSPTREAVLGALHQAGTALAAGGSRGRVLYVVYAGHGLRGRVLLKPTHGQAAALTGDELRAALAEVVSAVPGLPLYVFLDACRSESLFADRGPGEGDSGPDMGSAIAELERRAKAVSIGVLTAARDGRPAGEVRRLEAGYFSHVLTSGLAGAADADGDDVVRFGELAAFVAFHTQKLTGQMPWFDPPGGDLQAGAMDHRGRRARLIIPADAAGRFLVSAGAGAGGSSGKPVFAEAFKDRGRSLRLALPPGHYRVRREDQRRAGGGDEAAVEITAAAPVDLAGARWHALDASRGAAEPQVAASATDGEGPAFSAAFSPEVVSTLAAGFHAGRATPAGPRPWLALLELGGGFAPVGRGSFEPSLNLRLGRSFGLLAVTGIARAARSRVTDVAEPYSLHRYGAGLEVGISHLFSRARSEFFLAAGWASVLRLAEGGTSGDLAGLWADLGGRTLFPLGDGWHASVGGAFTLVSVRIDGRRRFPVTAYISLGVGRAF